MKSSTLLALGGLGALAWYLTRQRGGAVAPGPGTGFGHTESPPDDAIAGTEFIGQNDWFLSQGSRADVCDLPDDRHGPAWTDAQKLCVSQYHAGRAQSFYDMLWKPASRVPVSSLGPADFQLAAKFLGGHLDRRGVPWSYGQSVSVNDFNDNPAIAGLVGFNYVSKIFGADTTKVTDAAKAEFASAIIYTPTVTQGGENLLVVKEAPTPGDVFWGSTDPLLTQYGEPNKAWDSVFIDPRGPSLDFGFEPIEFPWGNLYFRCQLYRGSNTGYGFEMPWVCRELGYASDGGDGSSLTDKTAKASIIAKQARLIRTLDVLGALLKPDTQNVIYGAAPDADGNINVADLQVEKRVRPGLYAYKVGTVELWGCCLPAAPEDMAADLSQVTGKRLAGSTYGRDVGETPEQTAQSDYVPYVPPPPTRDAPTASGIPTVTKGAPVPTQTATTGYTLPTPTAGAPTSSPTIAGGGRRLNSII